MAVNIIRVSGYDSPNDTQITTMMSNLDDRGHTLLVVLLPILAVLLLVFLLVV